MEEALLIAGILSVPVGALAFLMRGAWRESQPAHRPNFAAAEPAPDHGLPITLPDDGMDLL